LFKKNKNYMVRTQELSKPSLSKNFKTTKQGDCKGKKKSSRIKYL